MQAFIHGIILAIGLILPLGVQNLFVFTQGVIQPTVLRTLPVVVTASICDTLLIVLAVQGVSLFIAIFVGNHEMELLCSHICNMLRGFRVTV